MKRYTKEFINSLLKHIEGDMENKNISEAAKSACTDSYRTISKIYTHCDRGYMTDYEAVKTAVNKFEAFRDKLNEIAEEV